MKNFSLPDYDLVEIGNAVKRLSQLTGVPCKMHEVPFLEAEGQLSLTSISDSIVSPIAFICLSSHSLYAVDRPAADTKPVAQKLTLSMKASLHP